MSSPKRFRRGLLLGIAAVAVLFVFAALVLHSQSFRQYALGEIVHAAQQTTGTRIAVRNMTLGWYPLAVEFDDVLGQNQGQIGNDPLFSASHITVNLKLLPLLRGRIEIERVELVRPSIHIRTDSNGRTNLPEASTKTTPGPRFEIQVALLSIRDGLIHYDDRQIPLSVELGNLNSRVAFDRATNSFRGQVTYDAGRIETPGLPTFEHSAALHFVADTTHCVVESIDLSTLHNHFRAQGELTDYHSPAFTGAYRVSVSGEELRRIMKNDAIPSGDLALQGEVVYRTAQGQTLLQRIHLRGSLESAALIVPANASKVVLKRVRAGYRLERGQLYVVGGRAEAFGGQVASDANFINLLSGDGRLRVAIRGAEIQQAIVELGAGSTGNVQVAGVADLDATADWKNNIGAATMQARAVIRRSAKPSTAKGIIPLEGTIAVDYDAAHDRTTFGPSNVRTDNERLIVSGVLSRNSSLNIFFATRDLHELTALAEAATPSGNPNGLAAYDLRGAAEFTGKISGAVKNPHLEGQLSAANLQIEGTSWRTVQARVGVDSQSLKVGDGSLAGTEKERVSFSGGTKLANWSFDPAAASSLHARVQNVSVAEFQRLAKTSYPVVGLLNGELSFSGSAKSPAGRGRFDLVQGVVWNEPVNGLAVEFDADQQTVHVTANASSRAGSLTAKATYEVGSQRYQVQGETRGLKLEQVRTLQKGQDSPTGVLTAEMTGSGTLDDPQLTGRAQIPALVVRGESFTGIDAHVAVRNKHVDLALKSTVEQSSLEVKAGVELTGAYPAEVVLNTGTVPIGPLLDKFMPGTTQGTTGQMEIHATLNGPLRDASQIQARAEIPTLRVQTKSIDLANVTPIKLAYRAGMIEVHDAELKGNGTDVRLNGSFPVQGTGDMNLAANGTLDLGLLQDWTTGGHCSGQVAVEFHAKGSKTQPVIQARARIVNAVYTSDALPVGIESLNGDISVDGNKLQIANLTGTAGGGTISIGGSAVYGNNPSFNLALDAKSVRVRQNGVRAVVDAGLYLTGATTASTLGGRITVDKLSFTEGSDLAEIVGQLSGDNTVSDASNLARRVRLNVAVQSADNLNLTSSQLSIGGSANLSVMGTVADPVILGRVGLTRGEVFFLGKRFEIQDGTIAFVNTVRTEPVVNLYVNTVVDQYTITVNLSGPLDRLKTSYTSDPALSTADIFNLLAFGRTSADAASSAATPASVGAESAVASAAGSQLASQVQKLTGISQLTFNPLAGNNQAPGAQVAVQQRVTGNILLTFSTDVTSAQNQSIQVQYRLKRNFTVSALRDENGGYGFDVRYHKAF
jgi:translocation and assembly module TamB